MPDAETAGALGGDRARRTRLIVLAAVIGLLFVAELIVGPSSSSQLRSDFSGLGIWGPLAMIVVYAVLVCVMVPGPLLAGASGLLFGTALGTPVSILGATLGACIAFSVARAVERGGRGPEPEPLLPGLSDKARFLSVLYARIAPGAPFAMVSYGFGVTRIRLRHFAAATVIGVAPRAFAFTALGGNLGNYSSPEAMIAIGVLVAMTIGGAILAWNVAGPTVRAGLRAKPRSREAWTAVLTGRADIPL
jgi:uncharacterized membrane protein YdjX (TVP38/TMEM64 family)